MFIINKLHVKIIIFVSIHIIYDIVYYIMCVLRK